MRKVLLGAVIVAAILGLPRTVSAQTCMAADPVFLQGDYRFPEKIVLEIRPFLSSEDEGAGSAQTPAAQGESLPPDKLLKAFEDYAKACRIMNSSRDAVSAETIEAARTIADFQDTCGDTAAAKSTYLNYLECLVAGQGTAAAREAADQRAANSLKDDHVERALQSYRVLAEVAGPEEREYALTALADILWNTDREGEAVTEYLAIIQGSPDAIHAREIYGRVAYFHHRTGRFAQAGQIYGTMADRFPNAKDALYLQYMAGYLYYLGEDHAGAVREFKRLLECHPGSRYEAIAKSLIARLEAQK